MEKSRKCCLRGFVTSVGDSDNFRFRHEPFLRGWRGYVSMLGFLFAFDRKAAIKWRIGSKGVNAMSKNTIHVRLCGVDAPEAMHLGRSGQPGFEEAFKRMKETIDGKDVTIHLLRRDQYNRMICQVLFKPHWFSPQHDLSLDLLEAGWGVMYEGNEAE
ncbi:putative endonuclease LCL3 [Porphyridium purpureum]|uniref:Putative endonuclease LCL3 n=1 Tax=Porphyridium purpureum TaxID=35688 RepID=A0A5J4YJR7_PORPP|nr:putative endonuclease LCL3 [Porphyridium purpureum]|eukprot:POR1386..scf210_14